MPAPNPADARAKTSARSARLNPSRASSGFKNTLNAYSEPSGAFSVVAAATARHALGLTSVALAPISCSPPSSTRAIFHWGDREATSARCSARPQSALVSFDADRSRLDSGARASAATSGARHGVVEPVARATGAGACASQRHAELSGAWPAGHARGPRHAQAREQ